MTAPRHLWSGDWQRESAAAADELARRQTPAREPSPPSPPASARPRTPSPGARALVQLRKLRPGGAVLTALAVSLSVLAGYAAVSWALGAGGDTSAHHTHLAGSPARTSAPGWLGVETVSFSPATGVTVMQVVPGSPADRAGLRPGDVIRQVGNQAVDTPSALDSAIAAMKPGQQVEIQYQRGQSSYTTQATLRARPARGP